MQDMLVVLGCMYGNSSMGKQNMIKYAVELTKMQKAMRIVRIEGTCNGAKG